MSKVLDKLARGEIVIGTNDTLGSPRLLEVMGFAGLDMVYIDNMFCPTDWETVASMVRSGQVYGVDTLVRIAAFPWINRTDPGLAVAAARTLGIGCTGVVFSVATVEEVQQVMKVSRGWHRDVHIHPFDEEGYEAYNKKVAAEALMIPLVESETAMANLDDILAVDGVKAVWLGMTDLTRMLGHGMDYGHPDVTRFLDHAIGIANKHGVAVAANVGYQFSRSFDDTIERVKWLVAHGVKIVLLQNNGYVIQWVYQSLLDRIKAEALGAGT